ncbi:MAG: hypothetical protein RLZZ393_1620 [Pseudomonadota bacterium]
MTGSLLFHAALGLVPVVAFLLALIWFDSYKLAPLRTVLVVLVGGAFVAGACYYLNGFLLGATGLPFALYSRWLAPLVEEGAKALVLVLLFRTHRIGFVADAAIFGFAIGAGFALFENVFYLANTGHGFLPVWFVRGFGTAFMHGGTVAVFGMMLMSLDERAGKAGLVHYLPGLCIAVAVHAGFNHFLLQPVLQAVLTSVVLGLLLRWAFRHSESAVAGWLGGGLDAGVEVLSLMHSGRFAGSPIGLYLGELRGRFDGEVLADMLCYLRLHTELAIRAKGMLLMREEGFDLPPDDDVRAKLVEMRHLEASIGRTGLAAMEPLLAKGRRDIWHLRMLSG